MFFFFQRNLLLNFKKLPSATTFGLLLTLLPVGRLRYEGKVAPSDSLRGRATAGGGGKDLSVANISKI